MSTSESAPTEEFLGDPAPTTTVLTPTIADSRPQVRWGAIIWGLILCAISASILLVTGSRANRAGFADWLGQLSGGTIALIAVLAVGGLILVLGLVAVLRRRP